MNRTRTQRIIWLLIAVAALAAVALVAYHAGSNGFGMMSRTPFGPFRGSYNYGPGFGFGFFALLPMLVIGFLLVWLFVSVISGPSGGRQSGGTAPGAADTSGVEKLRELAELHDRGALSDEEFTAAKHKLLGL